MSVKDVKKYYDEVCQQYLDMKEELRDFTELAEQNLYPPERLDMIKETIQPLMRNYEMVSYVMFLLNMPVKKSKQKSYETRNKKLLSRIEKENTKEGVLQTNKRVIEKLYDLKNKS